MREALRAAVVGFTIGAVATVAVVVNATPGPPDPDTALRTLEERIVAPLEVAGLAVESYAFGTDPQCADPDPDRVWYLTATLAVEASVDDVARVLEAHLQPGAEHAEFSVYREGDGGPGTWTAYLQHPDVDRDRDLDVPRPTIVTVALAAPDVRDGPPGDPWSTCGILHDGH